MKMARRSAVPEYFPEIANDLTAVRWGHALNSKQLLVEALQEKHMMLEADVVLGTQHSASGNLIPVMAHPPKTTSDLSLEEFLRDIMEANETGHRCGLKLDFKSLSAFRSSLDQLQNLHDQTTFPVMLSADILPGPVNSKTKPVDADRFLHDCVERFPGFTISIGWTTMFGGSIENAEYTQENIMEMEDAVVNHAITQPVTFSVRAAIAARSGSSLIYLRNNVANSTFTIWSLETDIVDLDFLRDLILNVFGRERVFLDIPKFLINQLQLNSEKMDSPRLAFSESVLDR